MPPAEHHAPKASIETREELLRHLRAPLGSVVVGRRKTAGGDVLVVQMTAPNAVPPDRRPTRFRGFDVNYEIVAPLKIG